jgi:hypothetical protein
VCDTRVAMSLRSATIPRVIIELVMRGTLTARPVLSG